MSNKAKLTGFGPHFSHFRATILRTQTAEDMRNLVINLRKLALEGSWQAIKLLFSYMSNNAWQNVDTNPFPYRRFLIEALQELISEDDFVAMLEILKSLGADGNFRAMNVYAKYMVGSSQDEFSPFEGPPEKKVKPSDEARIEALLKLLHAKPGSLNILPLAEQMLGLDTQEYVGSEKIRVEDKI